MENVSFGSERLDVERAGGEKNSNQMNFIMTQLKEKRETTVKRTDKPSKDADL